MKILISIIFSLVMASCNQNPDPKVKSCCKPEKSIVSNQTISEESIYNLSSIWTTQLKESIQLQHFSGKIVVAAMVFTHCESACPRIVADIQRLESELTKDELDQLQFLLISMDPDRDTPERMTVFALDHKLNSRWTLISSNREATIEIANVLGVRVKKLDGGGFDHSNIIHVLDQNGLIVFQKNGFVLEQDDLLLAIRNQMK